MNHWNDNLQHSVFVDTSKKKAVYAGGEGYLEHKSVSKDGTGGVSAKYVVNDKISTYGPLYEAISYVRRNYAEKAFKSRPGAKTIVYRNVLVKSGNRNEKDENYEFTYTKAGDGDIDATYWPNNSRNRGK